MHCIKVPINELPDVQQLSSITNTLFCFKHFYHYFLMQQYWLLKQNLNFPPNSKSILYVKKLKYFHSNSTLRLQKLLAWFRKFVIHFSRRPFFEIRYGNLLCWETEVLRRSSIFFVFPISGSLTQPCILCQIGNYDHIREINRNHVVAKGQKLYNPQLVYL